MIKEEYKLVRRGVRALQSCLHPDQKLMALEYIRRALDYDVKPSSNKQKDVEFCEKEKDSIYKFICNLAGDKCNLKDFVEISNEK